MKKLLFLSSALIMTTLGAFADDMVPNTDKKITGGAGTCTVDVLGVYDNNATANTIATWSLNSYECAAGQYLDETTLNCTECPIGSYCPGGTFTVEVNNSKNTCPADYTSDTAATAESECYMGCETQCTQQTCPEHSENCTHGVSSTTGRQYVDATCNAEKTFCSIDFECAPGYYKIIANSEFIIINTDVTSPFISCNLNNQPEADYTGVISNNCDVVGPGVLITRETSPQIAELYIEWHVSYNDHSPDNNDVISKPYISYQNEEKTFSYSYDVNFSTEITGNYVWIKPVKLFLGNPRLYELLERCAIDFTDANTNCKQFKMMAPEYYEFIKTAFETGESPTMTAEQNMQYMLKNITTEGELNYPWIYVGQSTDGEVSNYFALRQITTGVDVLFGTNYVNPLMMFLPNNGTTYCMSNSININWDPDNGTKASQSMCMYGDGLATPDDPVRPGYTFTGWKLVD